MTKIKTRKQAATLRAGVLHGRSDALDMEKTGCLNFPFMYLVLGTSRAQAQYEGKSRFFNFDLFSSAWTRSYEQTFENRFAGLNAAEAAELRRELSLQNGFASGRVKQYDLIFEDGSTAVAYSR